MIKKKHPVCCKKYMHESGSDVDYADILVYSQYYYECLDCGKFTMMEKCLNNGLTTWNSFEEITKHHMDCLEVDLMLMFDRMNHRLNKIDVSKVGKGRKKIGRFQHFQFPKKAKKSLVTNHTNDDDQFICPQCRMAGEELEHGDAYECECGLKFQSFGNGLYMWEN